MNNYDAEISRLRAEMARAGQLEAKLRSLMQQREQLAAQEAELREIRIEEQEDVDNLEGRSLARFVYALFGSLDERLDRERAEARAAAIKHEAVARELDDLEEDIAGTERELQSLAGCERRYEAALNAKAEQLKSSGTQIGRRLAEIERERRGLAVNRRETEEALRAGQQAQAAAEKLVDSLSGASNWSMVDIFTDGIVADVVKYSHMDEAQGYMEQLRIALRRFGAELGDVGASIDVNMGDFLGFADFFFDGFIADIAVNSRINNSLYAARDVLERIRGANSRLRGMLSECTRRERALDGEYERLVTGS